MPITCAEHDELQKITGANIPRTFIRKGQERLKATPRADMDGFVPCAENQAFETRYKERQECERRSYDAIRTGRMIYDHVAAPLHSR